MTDYLPLLTRAVASLDNDPGARRKVYDRARQALLAQLRAMNPPLAEAEITRERLALEEAIRRLDQQAGKGGAATPTAAAAKAAAPAAATAGPAAPSPREPMAPRVGPAPRPPAGAPATTPQAPPPVSVRDRPIEPASGAKAARDAAFAARQADLGSAESVRPARSGLGRTALGGPEVEIDAIAGTGAEFDSPPRTDELASSRDAFDEPRRSPRGRGSIDYAKADAQKAMKAKMIVGGIVGVLFGVAILIGFVHRDRILASLGLGTAPPRVATQPRDAGPSSDRIAQSPQTSAPATSVPAAAVAQRSVLYEENPGATEEQLQTFVGTAVWRTETVNPGPGRPPELGLRIEVEVPDRKMTVTISIRRNPDTTLPASHTIEVQFQTPNDPFGGVANLPGIRAKTTETAQGAPLVGLVVRVMPGFFLVGLSAIEADREQNLSLLRERGWLDVPFVYNNGRRAVLVIEKGTPGERAVNEVIASWGG
jgi:hypothetical protein